MNEAQSTAVRRVAGGAFTPNALLDYEDYIDQSCAALLAAFKRRAQPMDLSWWFGLFAMDVINRLAFSDSMGFLETGEGQNNLTFNYVLFVPILICDQMSRTSWPQRKIASTTGAAGPQSQA